MDNEFYRSNEYKKIPEYKQFKAEIYHNKNEYCAPKIELTTTKEENNTPSRPKNPKKSDSEGPSLSDLMKKVANTSTSLVTTSAIVAGAGAAVIAPEIFIPKDNIPIVYPIVTMEEIDIGNDYFTYDISIDNNDNDYKLYINNNADGSLVNTIDLVNGSNKNFIKDLTPSSSYTFKVYSEINDHTLYEEEFITKDGSVPTFIFDINEYLYNPYTTSIDYNVYISDPLNVYQEYSLEIIDNNKDSYSYGELLEERRNEGKYIQHKMEYCPMGPIKFDIYGMNTQQDSPTLIKSYDYIAKSKVPEITSFPIAYSLPSIDDISYRFVNHSLMVDVPFNYSSNLNDFFNIKVIVKDNEGNSYESYSYGGLVSVDLPDTVTSFSVEYVEVAHIDYEEKIFNSGKIEGTKQVVEGVKPKYIAVNKTRNRLSINLSPNIRMDSNIRLTDKSDGSVRNMVDFYEFQPLPDTPTTYTYQVINSKDEPISEEYSFTVDPSFYDVLGADTFIPTEPRKIVKTFNDNGTWNMYLYTGFSSTNPNLSWTTKITEDLMSGETNYYTSKDKVIEVTNLNSEYSFEYSIGEEHNGVYYETSPLDPVNYNTSTDNSDYASMTRKETIDNKTTIYFEFTDTDRVYDFDNAKMYIGNYTPITLNNSDFTYDSVNHKYKYQVSVDGEVAWYDLNFKANKNLYNIEKIKNIMPLKGNLCGPCSLYGYVIDQGGPM